MAAVDRRRRELDRLRDRMVRESRRIARREGWAAVTVRRVAEAVEWSPPKLYRLFGDKDGLLAALRAQAFGELLEALRQSARPPGAPPGLALVALAEAHARFVVANPELFDLMHELGEVPPARTAKPPEAQACFDLLFDAVAVLDPHAPLGRSGALEHTQALWAALFGIATLARGREARIEDPVDLSALAAELVAARLSAPPGPARRVGR